MNHRFDELAKDLAQGLSRRQALARLGGGLAGMLLGSLGLDRAWGQGNSGAAHFCHDMYPPGPSRGQCVTTAAACMNGDQTACASSVYVQCGPNSTTGRLLCGVSSGNAFCCAAGEPCCGDAVCCAGGKICCTDSAVCSVGTCVCPPGMYDSGGLCCPVGRYNSKGFCCLPDDAYCGSGCIDVQFDAQNCGDCGLVCKGGRICSGGMCICPATTTLCNDQCVNLHSDPNNCGACGAGCSSGNCSNDVCCDAGWANCGSGTCTNLSTDAFNCGSCGTACSGGMICSGGSCVCPTNTSLCGTNCVNLQTDNGNCGTCGNACASEESCMGGTCTQICAHFGEVCAYCSGGNAGFSDGVVVAVRPCCPGALLPCVAAGTQCGQGSVFTCV